MLRFGFGTLVLLAASMSIPGSVALAVQSAAEPGDIAMPAAANSTKQWDSAQRRGEIRVRRELAGAGALRLLERAKAEAEARQVEVSIAIVDRDGQLLAFARMGGAAPLTISNAIAKASTAAQLGMPSGQLETLLNDGRPSYLAIQDIVPLQGGIPVLFEGEVIGGIGCSGADPATDEAIAASVSEFVSD